LDTAYPQADNRPVRLISLRFPSSRVSPVDENFSDGMAAFMFRLSIWNAPERPYDFARFRINTKG
jgi:hypothetical protein